MDTFPERRCFTEGGNSSNCAAISLRLFENRVLRRILGPKADEVTEEWRKLYNGELHNLDSSPNIIRHVKSGRMMWAGHVASMGE
jgi:hypothetical protein